MRAFLFAAFALAISAGAAVGETLTIGDLKLDFDDPAMRPADPLQRQLVSDFLAALASKKPEALSALLHPASAACAKSDTGKMYLGDKLADDLKRTVPADAKIIMVPYTGADPAAATLPPGVATLPLPPSAVLGISYTRENGVDKAGKPIMTGVSILKVVAPSGDRLMLLEHCLTAKGEQVYADKKAAAARGTTDTEAPKR